MIKDVGLEIKAVQHQLQRLVSSGTQSYAQLQVSNELATTNCLFLYGGWANAVLNTHDRVGQCVLYFNRFYNITVFASEIHQDPLPPSNYTWAMTQKSRVMVLNIILKNG